MNIVPRIWLWAGKVAGNKKDSVPAPHGASVLGCGKQATNECVLLSTDYQHNSCILPDSSSGQPSPEPSCELGSAAVTLALAGIGAECQKTTVCSHAVQVGFPFQ